VILRENYRSALACQEMKEALERMDSGIPFVLLEDARQGDPLIRTNETAFQAALELEQNNVTLPGQGGRRPISRHCSRNTKPQ
jgi:NtrC-family two-component system sensor histidine kinase KinB